MKKSYKITISGKVQGVGYRRWFQRQAIQLQLSGWVRNLESGAVEALVITHEENMRHVIERAYKGPPLAQVTEVRCDEVEETSVHNDFQILK